MKRQDTTRLKQLSKEMRDTYDELKKSKSNKTLKMQAECLCEDLEAEFGVIAFKPEVPAATVKMFFKLSKLVWG